MLLKSEIIAQERIHSLAITPEYRAQISVILPKNQAVIQQEKVKQPNDIRISNRDMNLNQITVPSLDLSKAVPFYQTLGLELIVKKRCITCNF